MKIKKRGLFFIIILLVVISFMIFLSISKAIAPYLETVGAQEVQNAAARIIKNSINTIEIDPSDFVEISRDSH